MRSQIIDISRGIALFGMVYFHAQYIYSQMFGGSIIFIPESLFLLIGKIVAFIFIIVAGISFALGGSARGDRLFQKTDIYRIGLLSILALILSVFTHLFFPEQRISWGILHFFALASGLGIFFRTFGMLNILIGYICIWIGSFLQVFPVDTILLVPFGLYPKDFFSADYYPLFPWFGYYLLGYGLTILGFRFSFFQEFLRKKWKYCGFFTFLGRHSLIIYMIHVPIIYAIFLFYVASFI